MSSKIFNGKKKKNFEFNSFVFMEFYLFREVLVIELYIDISRYNIVCDEKYELVFEKLVFCCF